MPAVGEFSERAAEVVRGDFQPDPEAVFLDDLENGRAVMPVTPDRLTLSISVIRGHCPGAHSDRQGRHNKTDQSHFSPVIE